MVVLLLLLLWCNGYGVAIVIRVFAQRKLTVGGRISEWLVTSLTRLDLTNKEICYYLYVPSEPVECKLVKLETSRTVILW